MRFRYIAFAAAFVALFGAASSATAGAYMYAGQRKRICCGVLAVTDRSSGKVVNGTAINEVGALFYLLEQRSDLRPPGWSFENPLAPGSASSGLGKNEAVYWVVDLAATRNLSRMHVLYLPANGNVYLDDQDREKLRRFVDGGGVLWIDNVDPGGPLDFKNTFFIRDFRFNSASAGFELAVNRHHPILSSPHMLSGQETAMLGATPGEYDCDPGYTAGRTWGSMASEPTDFDILLSVVENTMTSKPSVAANGYGSGRVVATANYVGKGCFYSYPYNTPNLKFALNVVAWASAYTTLRKDPRHTGYSIDTVGGNKLVEQWCLDGVAPITGSGAAPAETGPVIYKNVVFYSGIKGAPTLYAIDLNANTDLDGDGDVDDGVPNPSGTPPGVDLLWTFQAGQVGDWGVLSAPTVVSVQDPRNPSASVEAVLVTSSKGVVYMLEAFPNIDGILSKAPSPPVIPPFPYTLPALQPTIEKPMPPLYINGWVYAVNGEGRLCAYNPSLEAWAGAVSGRTVNPAWQVPSMAAIDYAGAQAKTGPAFGFVQNSSSGAVVGVVYWCASPSTQTKVNEQNDFINGVPVFCSNDRLRLRQTSSDRLIAECQTTYREGTVCASPKPVVWYKSGNGTVVIPDKMIFLNCKLAGDQVDTNSVQTGSIVIRTPSPIPPDATIYATYALDYAGTQGVVIVQPRVRNPLEPRSNPVNMVPPTAINALPALGPDNMMFITGTRADSSNARGGGSVYGIYNDGSTQETRWHYFLHSGTTLPPGMNTTISEIPAVIVDPNTGAPMMEPQSFSSPVYAGDKVFVTVTSNTDPRAALLCFKANSDFVIRVTESAGYGSGGAVQREPKKLYSTTNDRRMSVKIWQPNLMMEDASGIITTPLMAAIPVPTDMVDYDRGTISFTNFDRLKLRGTGTSFMQTNTFSPSLPVWVFLDNVEVPVDFSTWGPCVQMAKATGTTVDPVHGDSVDLSGWNNLLWYYVLPPYEDTPCSGVHSSPIVIGNTVYFVTDDGVLYALNAETGETQGGPIDAKNVIWQTQVGTGSVSRGSNISPAGANGVLLVPLSDGLHAFGNPMTLVADSNRVVELDGGGELAWSVDSITVPVSVPSSNTEAPPVRGVPVNKPARVRYIGAGDLLVVNSGANQVARINRGGFVGVERFKGDKFIRYAFDRFCDPKRLLRPGQPTQISGPTDAILWQELEADEWMTVHCLVADSGNHRILDLVYQFKDGELRPLSELDPKTGFYLPYVNWVSRTESMNQNYTFSCIQIVDTSDPPTVKPRTYRSQIWAAISNLATGTDNPGPPPPGDRGLGGAIVGLNWRERPSLDDPWNYNITGSGEITARCDHVTWSDGDRPLANPRFFEVKEKSNGRHLLVCDDNGVYDVLLPTPPVTTLSVVGSLRDLDYRSLMRQVTSEDTGKALPSRALGAPLTATSVQELHNGHWLISNGFSGEIELGGRTFHGEVFQYDPVKKTIVWSAPRIVAADEGSPWEQRMGNSSPLEQPRSALRQY